MSKIKDRLIAKSMATPAGTDKVRAIIDGVDQLASEMEAWWGVGRLLLLVSDEYRERFDRQRRKFNAAIWDGAPADVEIEGERTSVGSGRASLCRLGSGARGKENGVI